MQDTQLLDRGIGGTGSPISAAPDWATLCDIARWLTLESYVRMSRAPGCGHAAQQSVEGHE
jgi:hypothetical protein